MNVNAVCMSPLCMTSPVREFQPIRIFLSFINVEPIRKLRATFCIRLTPTSLLAISQSDTERDEKTFTNMKYIFLSVRVNDDSRVPSGKLFFYNMMLDVTTVDRVMERKPGMYNMCFAYPYSYHSWQLFPTVIAL